MTHKIDIDVLGPWSLATSRAFWEGFSPAELAAQPDPERLHTVFRVDRDWSRAAVDVTQRGGTAHLSLAGDGDLDAAAEQVARFLALDVDARGWPAVACRDPVLADVVAARPGLRPCGFHSPYEAAAWAVLSQRTRIPVAARMRDELVARHGDDGAFPAPATLRALNPDRDLDLPGRKPEYLHAVAGAALDGLLDGAALRAVDPEVAVAGVRQILGLGPFGAELVVVRGANAPDAQATHEPRLADEVLRRYGRPLTEVADGWRPFRTWASVYLRSVRA